MKIKVDKDNVNKIETEKVKSGEYNITELEFQFTEEYEGLIKKAIFTNSNQNKSYIVEIQNNKCNIAGESLEKNGTLKIGVYAYELENEKLKLRYSPKPTFIGISEGSYNKDAKTSEDLTPSEAEILETKIQKNTNDINELEETVSGLHNYDDTEIRADIASLQTNKADKSEIPDVSNFITKEVNNLTNYELKTNTGSSIALSIDSSTYVMTLQLKNSAGTVISTGTIDLPLETMVVGASYDSLTKEIVLTLKNGNTTRFSVADLVSGLQSEITSNNKLSSDLVDDTNSTNKFVTSADKTNWNGKENSSNKVITISSSSTDTQYPSAKAVYDYIQALNGNGVSY